VLARLSALGKNLAIYGLGDVANNIVSFLLLPLYVHFLTPADYGVISLLAVVEIVAKIIFRWGVDAAFMRLYYDCESDTDRQRLASTIFWFLLIVNGAVLVAVLAAAPVISRTLLGEDGYTLIFVLQLLNTFVIGFQFLPFHVLRMTGRSKTFGMLTTTRTTSSILVRFALIVGLHMGVKGYVLTDVIITAIYTVILARWFAPLLRPMFSKPLLKEALHFGLPRLPHGIAQQLMYVGDRYVLRTFAGLAEVGLYGVGGSFSQAMKLFLSAFEYAWAPFYFETAKEKDAPHTFRIVTTYGLGVLVLLEAGLAAIAQDIVRLMTRPEFYGAAVVIPWLGLGTVFQGVYLLTSIGLNITKQTKFYPVATITAAAVSMMMNLLLVPKLGALGAAYSNVIAYGTLAGVAMWLSQRVYPMRYEYGRVVRLVIAGIGAYLVSWIVPHAGPAWLGVLTRGSLVCGAYPLLLIALGFYDRKELEFLSRQVQRLRARRPPKAIADEAARTPAPALSLDEGAEPVEVAGMIVEVPLQQDVLPMEDEPPATLPGTESGAEPGAGSAAGPEADVPTEKVRP
jgi:O-antigen/teichoic acid export membrane protein